MGLEQLGLGKICTEQGSRQLGSGELSLRHLGPGQIWAPDK